MVKHPQTIRSTNFLSVFHYFPGLALKRLKAKGNSETNKKTEMSFSTEQALKKSKSDQDFLEK